MRALASVRRSWLGPGPALLAAISAAPATARVESQDASGFTINVEQRVARDADAVFAALAEPARWWSDDHSWSGSAANMSLQPVIGGCWCEAWDGAVAEHGRILFWSQSARRMLLRSEPGPLSSMAATGKLEWTIFPSQEGGSRIRLRYEVAGRGLSEPAFAAVVDRVFTEQVTRLAAYVDAPQPSQ